MTVNSQLIDEVVRNVMRELDLSPTSQSAAPHSPPPPRGPVELLHRVITEDVLAGDIPSGGTIIIPDQAVITPSGRDFIQRHGISVRQASQTAAGTSTDTGLALQVGDMKGLSAPAAAAGWPVQSAVSSLEAARFLAQKCGEQPAVCGSAQPSVVACLVNRNSHRRVAVVTPDTCLVELFREMNPDTICLSTAGWTFAELWRMLKLLGGRSPEVPAAWKELS